MPPAEQCQRNLDIEIPAGEVEREYSRVAQSLQRRARIAGFRPGKAPLTLVRQRFSGQIREEVLQTLLPAHLRAAFEREQVEPVSTPTIEELHFLAGEPIRFKTSFEVLAPFELGDYKSLHVEMQQAAVEPRDIDAIIGRLRERYATFEPIEHMVASDGMTAVIGLRRQGEPDAAEGEANETRVEVGGERTLPEFNQALRGMLPGETREFSVEYPADFGDLAGRKVDYVAKLKRLEKKQLPELSDEFIKEHTRAESLEVLRDRIGKDMLEERRFRVRREAEEQLLEKLLEQHDFPIPRSLVEKQIDALLQQQEVRHQLSEGAPRKSGIDREQLRGPMETRARRQVKTALILERIGERENIDVSEALDKEIALIARERHEPPEATRHRLTENGNIERLKTSLRNERTLAFLLANATGTSLEEPAPETGAGGMETNERV